MIPIAFQQSTAMCLGVRTLLLTGLGVAVLMFLLLWRLDVYPTPWFDEGAYLNVARTFAEDSIYAEGSSDSYRFNAAVVSVGPTVILPIAGLYKLFGVSFIVGRFVIVGYSLLLLATLYFVAARLIDTRAAWIAVLLALFGWGNWVPFIFRTVMGEAVGTFYMLAGLLFWLNAKGRSLPALLGSGLMFGLAGITKPQIGLITLIAMEAMWLANLLWYRQYRWYTVLIPGVIAAALFGSWTFYSWYLLGAEIRDPLADIAVLRSLGNSSYFSLNIMSVGTNLLGLVGGFAFSGLFVPALLLALARSLRRERQAAQWALPTMLLMSSVGMYVLTESALPEHNRGSIPMFLLGSIFVTALLHMLTGGFHLNWLALSHAVRGRETWTTAAVMPIAALGLVLVLGFIPLLRAVFNVTRSGSDAPYQVALYLDEHVPPDTVIETWDREFAALTDHNYHFAPAAVQSYHNAHLRDHANNPPVGALYDFTDPTPPEYVIVGPMSYWVGLYPPERLAAYDVVLEVGDMYVVYRLR